MMFKQTVVWNGMHPAISASIDLIDDVTLRVLSRHAICTSARDGKHSTQSLHYVGRAIDLRINDRSRALWERYHAALRGIFGPAAWDVLLKIDNNRADGDNSHIHIEFDPKPTT